MTHEAFIDHVAAHAGVSRDRADMAARIVLATIGGYLTDARRQQIADELPPGLRGALLAADDHAVPVTERLIVPGETMGHARELLASVCRVLGEELSSEALDWLWLALPVDLSQLVAPTATERRSTDFVPGIRDTLAAGRPGSHHAIGDTPATRNQSSSVDAANPHGATKLSSTPGTTQERTRDTLADAHGEPGRTLASAKR